MRYCEQCGAAFRVAKVCPGDGTKTRADLFDPLVGRVLGDRYRILERVGAGGMGQVYRAAHNRIACVFAVKVLYGDLAYDGEMLARFLREAELASCLQSRYIVRVTDFGNEGGGLPYMVMEYLDGPSLHDVVTRQGPLEPARAARIAERIARGLGLAHERGVVHRDLKPENVALVTEDDEPDVVKLLDFGVARVRDGGEKLTAHGIVVGTPLYMSPEHVMGAELDGRSDLYSLGVCLFEMLSGKLPFSGATVSEIGRKQISEPAPSLRPFLESQGGPVALDDVVQKLLAKRPADRYASCREVVDAISRAVSAQPSATTASRLAPSRVTKAAIEQAILLGAPLYNAGDHAACRASYERTATEIMKAGLEPAAVLARLAAALRRASTRTSPTEAAWDLRYAFDDLLATELELPAGDVLAVELPLFRAIADRREAEGALDIVGDYAVAFARGLAGKLQGDPARAASVAALGDAIARADARGAGASALPVLGPLLASIGTEGPRPTQSGRPSAAPVSLPTRAAVADDTRERILRAIRVGAPAYNEGRPEVCARVYRDAAKEILDGTRNDASAEGVTRYLERALRDASGRAPNDAAWVLRHAFDAILASSA